jgi:hypothetical protein
MSDTGSHQPGPGPPHAGADGTSPAWALLGPTDASTYGLAASDLLTGSAYLRHRSTLASGC